MSLDWQPFLVTLAIVLVLGALIIIPIGSADTPVV